MMPSWHTWTPFCKRGHALNMLLHCSWTRCGRTACTHASNRKQMSAVEHTPNDNTISLADRQRIYRILADEFEFGTPIPMATIAFALMNGGIDKEAWGYKKLKAFLAQMDDFLSFTDIIAGGVPQRLVTINKRDDWSAERSSDKPAPPVEPLLQTSQADDDPTALLMRRMAGTPDYLDGPVPQGVMDELHPNLDEFCYLPTSTLDILRSNIPQGTDVYALLVNDWAVAYREGALRYYEGKVIYPLHMLRSDGRTPIEISIRHVSYNNPESKPWYACYVNTYVRPERPTQQALIPSRELEQFGWLGPWEQFLSALAGLALPESWDFEPAEHEGPATHKNAILKSYICTTFYRLKLEDKVCIDDAGSFAAFNTGLVTRTYDDIYACFEPQAPATPPWKFVGFCTGGSRGLGKRLVSSFNPLPEPPAYFERKEDLLFDLEKDLIIDFDHVLIDNIARLPHDFLAEELRGDREAVELLARVRCVPQAEKDRIYKELGELIEGDARLFRRLRRCIEDAVDVACKRVRWNFKTAIPCYYPRANAMSLLLPLCLLSDDEADLALVVQLMPSGNYQGQTVLTMRQAYMNARLICRPDSEWLTTAPAAEAEVDEE